METVHPAPSLLGMSLKEIREICTAQGMPSFSAAQICSWLYGKRVKAIEEMSNISRKNREWLAANYTIGRRQAMERQVSRDGTVKYLLKRGSPFLLKLYISLTAAGEPSVYPVRRDAAGAAAFA